jgi:type I restriction enzyme S subunit
MKVLLSKVTKGATVHRLSTDSIRELLVSLPSKTDQNNTVEKVDLIYLEIEKMKTLYEIKINDLKELKKSLMQRALSGELTQTSELTTA